MADERIDATWEDGSKKIATYWIAGQQVSYRHWESNGQLSMEYGMQDGRVHGPFRTWHENGQLHEETNNNNTKHPTTAATQVAAWSPRRARSFGEAAASCTVRSAADTVTQHGCDTTSVS